MLDRRNREGRAAFAPSRQAASALVPDPKLTPADRVSLAIGVGPRPSLRIRASFDLTAQAREHFYGGFCKRRVPRAPCAARDRVPPP
jgi:hypothetical protein